MSAAPESDAFQRLRAIVKTGRDLVVVWVRPELSIEEAKEILDYHRAVVAAEVWIESIAPTVTGADAKAEELADALVNLSGALLPIVLPITRRTIEARREEVERIAKEREDDNTH